MVSTAALLHDTPSSPSNPQDPDERETRILSHRYLCRRGARRFLRVGLEREDLEQVATIGLVKATDRYDARFETPFEAFAWRTILGELGHHVRDHEHLLRAPRDLRALDRRLARVWERLALRLEREPTDRELAYDLGLPSATVRDLRTLRSRTVPLDIDDPRVANEVELTTKRRQAGTMEHAERVVLGKALASLPKIERHVLYGLYWLNLSRTEIGRRLAVSPKVVVRLHRAALRRLRRLW